MSTRSPCAKAREFNLDLCRQRQCRSVTAGFTGTEGRGTGTLLRAARAGERPLKKVVVAQIDLMG